MKDFKKINVAELLKDCPKGMELDCAMFDNVTLVEVDFYNKHHFDYRELIPKGVAIDCTNLNIY